MQSHNYDAVQPVLLGLSVLLYFAIFALMNMAWYKSEFLFGTFSKAMGDPLTYMGLALLLVFVYICEKATGVYQGKWQAFDQSSNTKES